MSNEEKTALKAILHGATHRYVNALGQTIYGCDIGHGNMQMMTDDLSAFMPITCFVGNGMISLIESQEDEGILTT